MPSLCLFTLKQSFFFSFTAFFTSPSIDRKKIGQEKTDPVNEASCIRLSLRKKPVTDHSYLKKINPKILEPANNSSNFLNNFKRFQEFLSFENCSKSLSGYWNVLNIIPEPFEKTL